MYVLLPCLERDLAPALARAHEEAVCAKLSGIEHSRSNVGGYCCPACAQGADHLGPWPPAIEAILPSRCKDLWGAQHEGQQQGPESPRQERPFDINCRHDTRKKRCHATRRRLARLRANRTKKLVRAAGTNESCSHAVGGDGERRRPGLAIERVFCASFITDKRT